MRIGFISAIYIEAKCTACIITHHLFHRGLARVPGLFSCPKMLLLVAAARHLGLQWPHDPFTLLEAIDWVGTDVMLHHSPGRVDENE